MRDDGRDDRDGLERLNGRDGCDGCDGRDGLERLDGRDGCERVACDHHAYLPHEHDAQDEDDCASRLCPPF